MVQVFRLGLAALLFLLGLASFGYLRSHHPTQTIPTSMAQAPLVSTLVVTPRRQSIPIDLNGLVASASEVVLAAETHGVITTLSPRLLPGATFKSGEVLLSVDDAELQKQLSTAQAASQLAKNNLSRLQSQQKLDQSLLGIPNVTKAYRQQMQELQTQLELAQTDEQLAELRLNNAHVRAPFDGRVQHVFISAGQRVTPGIELIRFYGASSARVRLAISDRQLLLMNPQHLQKSPSIADNVLLRQNLYGQYRYWRGQLLGLEANLDTRNQMAYLLVNINQAFKSSDQTANLSIDEIPLLTGQVLEARVSSRLFEAIALIPRQLIQPENFVWCVNEELRLYRHPIQMIYSTHDQAYVQGLKSKQMLVSTIMNLAVEGMRVRIQGEVASNSKRVKASTPPS